jgi:non-specific protein-tyrosine kinase
LDFRRGLAVLRHWWWLFAASVILAGGVAYGVSINLPKVYEGKATLIVGQSLTAVNPNTDQLQASQQLSRTYANVATTRPILQKVIDQLGLSVTTEDLSKVITARATADTTFVTITAQDGDPARAAEIANAVAQHLIAASPAIQGVQADVQSFIDQDLKATQTEIEQTQAEVTRLTNLPYRTAEQDQQLRTLQDRLATLRSSYSTLLQYSSNSAANLLTVVEPAVGPPDPVSPRPLLNALLAAVVGLLLAVGIASLAEHLDDRLKTSEEVEGWLGLPTLGGIVRMKGDAGRHEMYRLATLMRPRSPAAEAYRALRTNVAFASVDKPLRTILVTSSVPREGKTTTAANLAIALAQAGQRTLLVDGDLRKPGIHRLFDLPNTYGLTTLLRFDDTKVSSVVHQTEVVGLRVLTSGPLPPNPAEVLGSQRMRNALVGLQGEADIVVLDSPPLQAATDAAIVSSIVDGTILVINTARTRRADVRHGREALAKVNARVLGVVLNRLSGRARAGYYYDYYAEDTRLEAAEKPAQGTAPQPRPDAAAK